MDRSTPSTEVDPKFFPATRSVPFGAGSSVGKAGMFTAGRTLRPQGYCEGLQVNQSVVLVHFQHAKCLNVNQVQCTCRQAFVCDSGGGYGEETMK
ncbi:hypothetical protein Mal65_47990 [Crateriforma conspicua]|nr:hypothetical protein Mal65_47990 [Crateriforma conspicua]